jgi:branched-chain amino acid transport system permease protein
MLYLNGAIIGIFAGAAYSLVAVSITLMFRSTGVLSFAHAAFAMVGAYTYADFAGDKGWPGPVAALTSLCITVAFGLLVERIAIRPVSNASSSTKLIVTLGILSATTGMVLQIYGFAPISSPLLLPDEFITIGDLRFSYQQVAVLVAAGVLAVALGAMLQRSRLGSAVRAAAENAETAQLMGVSLPQVARLNWALGAGLAGLTGILVAPLSVITAATFPLLLTRALTATLIGGLVSLPLTFAGGLIVGIVQSITILRSSAPGAQDLVTLFLVVGLLLGRRNWPAETSGDAFASSTAARLPSLAPVTERIGGLYARSQPVFLTLVAVGAAFAIYLPATDGYWGFVGSRGLFYVIEALSLVLLVGWGGQVSLMHGAYVGIGAFTTAYLVGTHGVPVELAVALAAFTGMVMGAIAGLPALRLTGLQFGIASLAFAAAASEWLFKRPEFPKTMSRESFFGLDLFDDSHLFMIMLPMTAVLYLLVWNLRRSTFGPLLLSSRDAATTVAHFGADPKRTRMATFLFASFIASLGGAFYGILLTGFQPFDFAFALSIQLLIFAVVGGSQSLGGPIVAGFLFGVVPQILQGESGTSASAGPDIVAGVLVIALMALRPAGIASLFRVKARAVADRLQVRPVGRFGLAIAAAAADHKPSEAPRNGAAAATNEVIGDVAEGTGEEDADDRGAGPPVPALTHKGAT